MMGTTMNTHAMTRREAGIGLIATLAGATLPAQAQTQRESVRLLCGYPAGGSVDIVCRKLAEKLQGRYALSAVVENRSGAAGRLAVEEIKRAAPDGAALLITPASVLTMYPHVYRQLAYDPFVDLAPVSTVATTAFALAVGPKVPASVTSIEALVRWCKGESAPAACGNPGAGSMPHFMALLLARELGVELSHVPYRGGLVAMQAAAAGEVAAALSTEVSARPLVQAGKLRVLATTGPDRSAFHPAAPTFREAGLDAMTRQEWFGAFVPARTLAPQITLLAAQIQAALGEADVRETWDKTGLMVDASPPEQLAASMRREHDFWGPIVKASGFTPEA
jgi:tripartite-type tricarboxylate transporter receptor subunit TctC